MAELDSYVTGVGPYPSAPNTSVQQFLSEHPEYTNGSAGGNKWWTDIANVVSAGQEYPAINVHYRDYLSFRRQYDDWVNSKTNDYNALVKTWEAAQKSPLNESELLEAAGYNRNWLQGAANSGVNSFDPVSPMLSRSSEGNADPMQSIFAILQQSQAFVDSFLNVREKMADINLKQSQAEQISALTPYKAMQSYISSAERGWRLYPDYFAGKPNKFPLDRGMTVSTIPVPDNSVISTMTELQANLMVLDEEGKKLTNQQREWVVNTAQPLQEKMYDLQQKYLTGQISLQAIENEVAEASKEARKEYGSKGMAQQYYLRYVDAFLDLINTGCKLYSTIKTGQDIDFGNAMEWMKNTGEITDPLPGSLSLPAFPVN